MFARATSTGELAANAGKVEIRYRPNDGRRYDAMAKNLAIVDAKLLPDDTCSEATAAPRADSTAKEGGDSGPARAKRTSASTTPKTPSKRHTPTKAVHDPKVVFYTDGACTGNPGPAGLGVVMLVGSRRRERSEYLGQGTNNIAELTAIERALAMAAELEGPVLVNTDSQYAIGVLARGWKAKANGELVERIRKALAQRDDIGLSYVPGHSGVPLNERADELARQAIRTRKTLEEEL
ncbi:MAG: ribonuclease H [Polyangiaceae bacterium]